MIKEHQFQGLTNQSTERNNEDFYNSLLDSTILCLCYTCSKVSPLEYLIIYIIDNSPISVDMGCNKRLSSVLCTFEFTNNANEDLYLLKRETPLEGLVSPFIAVSLDDIRLPYNGPLVTRLAPTIEEFLLLKEGESAFASINVTDAFHIDTDGLYTIQYNKPLYYITVKEREDKDEIKETKEIFVREFNDIYLEDTHRLLQPKLPLEGKPTNIVYLQSCTDAAFTGGAKQNAQTLAAHKKLCAQYAVARDRVGNKTTPDPLYKTWFGTLTNPRADKVKGVYKKCEDGLKSKAVTYNNNGQFCQPNWIAYTFRGTTTVNFCEAYYSLPTYCKKDIFTKEGMLAHEWTHAFGSTTDYVHGADKCKDLATKSPEQAINNGDSYRLHYCNSY